jgi:uncharacterized protein involved in type VI secretion and phage assembly
MKTKLTVKFNGQEFTRTTARKYTHVVLVKRCAEYALQRANLEIDTNAQYMVDHAQGKAEVYSWEKSEDIAKDVAKGQAILAIGMEAHQAQYRAAQVAKVKTAIEAGEYEQYSVEGWSGSLALAQKVASAAKNYCLKHRKHKSALDTVRFYADVQIVEI